MVKKKTFAQSLSKDISKEILKLNLPYELIPTNISGVYVSPPPPDDFDPKIANEEQLVKYGIMFRHPIEGDHKLLHDAWNNFFSKRRDPKKHIIPILETRKGKVRRRNRVKHINGNFTNNAWSGGILKEPRGWNTVVGHWVIPTVSEPEQPAGVGGIWNSSSWIGLDGVDTDDLLQAGIEQMIDANGNPSYVAWYEWYSPIKNTNSPAYIVQTKIQNFPINKGDQVYCSVQYINNKAGLIKFTNETTGKSIAPITLTPPPGATLSGTSIEWVMEAPDGGYPHTSLPSFTQLVFTGAVGTSSDSSVVGDPLNADSFDIKGSKMLTSTALASGQVTIDFIG